MLIRNVCRRACEAIIDELVVASQCGKYPPHLDILLNALLELSEFDYYEIQSSANRETDIDHVYGGGLVSNLLAASLTTLQYGNLEQTQNYANLITHMCMINPRFKKAFIESATADGGPESYRFELGDVAVDICKSVLQAIN